MIIFTDGSTIGNGKKNSYGGVAIYVPPQTDHNELIISYSLVTTQHINVTNNIAELIAAIIAIEHAIESTKSTIYIYTDSKYVINCATTYAKKWIANQWKTTKNKEVENLWLVYHLIQLTKAHPVIFKHVKAHTVEPSKDNVAEHALWKGNTIADHNATAAANNLKIQDNNTKILNWANFAATMLQNTKRDMQNNLPFPPSTKIIYRNLLTSTQMTINNKQEPQRIAPPAKPTVIEKEQVETNTQADALVAKLVQERNQLNKPQVAQPGQPGQPVVAKPKPKIQAHVQHPQTPKDDTVEQTPRQKESDALIAKLLEQRNKLNTKKKTPVMDF